MRTDRLTSLLIVAFLVLAGFSLTAAVFPHFASAQQEKEIGPWEGEVKITSDVFVDEGEVLTIKPGTVVIFETYDWSIFVHGRVEALGKEDSRITFRANYDITNAWKGFQLYEGGSKFRWCGFNNGYYSIRSWRGAQTIEYCNFTLGGVGARLDGDGNTVHGCSFQDMTFLGLSLWGNDSVVSSCVMRECYDGGVFLKNNTGNLITNCLINPGPGRSQWNGIRLLDAFDNTISNCSFTNNNYALNIEGKCHDNLISDCTFLSNVYGIIAFTPEDPHGHEEEHPHQCEHYAEKNIIQYNIIEDCPRAIMVQGKDNVVMGNQVEGATVVALCFASEDTGNNKIYLNNFINNSVNCLDPSSGNEFHNSKQEGNYWSNNTGADLGKGLTDPFGPDLFPLAEPLEFINGRLEDFDTDGDGYNDYRDPDDDGDGYSDREELENDWDPKDKFDPEDASGSLITPAFFAFLVMLAVCIGIIVIHSRRKDMPKKDDE